MAARHFLDIDQFSYGELRHIIDIASSMKTQSCVVDLVNHEKRPVLVMIFEKPSTRTRVSFDVAMRQLGGETVVLNQTDMQLGRGETVADTARVLSRYADMLMLRCTDHNQLLELSENAHIPVINGLTNKSHPCQILADILTFEEKLGSIEGRTVAWIGDGNNVANSWIHAAARLKFKLNIATPEPLSPDQDILDWVKQEGGEVFVTSDAAVAAYEADCIVTDVWVSMGDADAERRYQLLRPYQVDADLMAKAKDHALFMHCLPAHRGDEVSADVIDGPQSVVFDEAENRLHVQKAVLAWCLGMIDQK